MSMANYPGKLPDCYQPTEHSKFAEQWKDAYQQMQADVLKRIDEFNDKWCMYSDKKDAHEQVTEALQESMWWDYREWMYDDF